MNFNKMYSVQELASQIRAGKRFIVAGHESVLNQLPKGTWIGGTIPYFMGSVGSFVTRDKLFATELPDYCRSVKMKFYGKNSIHHVFGETPTKGFGFIILPASSDIHLEFATKAPEYEDFANRPLIGWVSGIHLDDLGRQTAKVVNGETLEFSDSKAVVAHIDFDSQYVCEIGIVNIFSPGSGDTIEFLDTGFEAREVLVNGQKREFIEYVQSKGLDLKLPLVANYAGAMINVSFQKLDLERGAVVFYAPVFPGVKYRHAESVGDYFQSFARQLPQGSEQILFSCNCILNFLYSGLESKKTGDFVGPLTFGEIAYQLLNQTLVYLKIQKL